MALQGLILSENILKTMLRRSKRLNYIPLRVLGICTTIIMTRWQELYLRWNVRWCSPVHNVFPFLARHRIIDCGSRKNKAINCKGWSVDDLTASTVSISRSKRYRHMFQSNFWKVCTILLLSVHSSFICRLTQVQVFLVWRNNKVYCLRKANLNAVKQYNMQK